MSLPSQGLVLPSLGFGPSFFLGVGPSLSGLALPSPRLAFPSQEQALPSRGLARHFLLPVGPSFWCLALGGAWPGPSFSGVGPSFSPSFSRFGPSSALGFSRVGPSSALGFSRVGPSSAWPFLLSGWPSQGFWASRGLALPSLQQKQLPLQLRQVSVYKFVLSMTVKGFHGSLAL